MIHRFFLKENFHENTFIFLQEDEHHHLAKVLRIQEQEDVELINGLGFLALAKVTKIEKNKTELKILHIQEQKKSSFHVSIAVALMRTSKLEYIVEKATELGVDRIILFKAELSIQDNLSKEKIFRLENIIISAMKQSKRLFMPSLEIGITLEELLSREGEIYFGDVKEDLSCSMPELHPCTMFITGPESGFSKKENALLQKNAKGIRINPNILRAETAPIVALSLLCVQKS